MQSKLEGLVNASGNLCKQKWLGKYYWDTEDLGFIKNVRLGKVNLEAWQIKH